VVPGSTKLPRLTGVVRPGAGAEQFRAVCPVAIGLATEVEIDVKPGAANTINLGSGGELPVAILSTTSFDATTVEPRTVRLAGAPVATTKRKFKVERRDVNGDRLADLVLHVETEGLELTPASTSATLEGATRDGRAIFGTDAVEIVPPKKRKKR
jgi:hypothetical protein